MKTVQFSRDALMPARIVFVGARRVGTSSILRRFNLGLHTENYRPETQPVVKHVKNVFHPTQGFFVTVEFWDVEGADEITAFRSAQKAHAASVVYDISNRSSFELAQKYLDGINPRVSALLIGNKVDLKNMRKVSYEEGRLLARIHRVEFMETSARLNYNVDEAIRLLVSCVPDEYLLPTRGPHARHHPSPLPVSPGVCSLCSYNSRTHGASRQFSVVDKTQNKSTLPCLHECNPLTVKKRIRFLTKHPNAETCKVLSGVTLSFKIVQNGRSTRTSVRVRTQASFQTFSRNIRM